MHSPFVSALLLLVSTGFVGSVGTADEVPRLPVEAQPLAANIERLQSALGMLGAPPEQAAAAQLQQAITARDAQALQRLLDPHVLLVVSINPELRVKVARGPAAARIQQYGFTPVLIKVLNEGTVTGALNVHSPQGGNVFDGASDFSLQRQQQTELNRDPNTGRSQDRFLNIEMFRDPPMTANLSGLEVEYALALIGSSQSGRREATIGFDIGQGTQDLGFRGEVPVLFDVASAIPVTLRIRDEDGSPTSARLTFRDAAGRVLPPQAKRVAPDFFFQPQIYRPDGGTVLLPPGPLTMTSSRGPEYIVQTRQIEIPAEGQPELQIDLERWIDC